VEGLKGTEVEEEAYSGSLRACDEDLEDEECLGIIFKSNILKCLI